MATKKKARKDETEEAAAAPQKPSTTSKRKRKRGSSAAAASTTICNDDVLRSIFARLPVRSLVVSMTLSKHHRRMILSPEFRSCWGLDLRVKPTPSEMLPNLSAGPLRDGAKHT